jgi:hypothetical protein
VTDEPLFGGYDPPEEPASGEALSAGQRLTLRQHGNVKAGIHPLTRGPLHPDAARELASGTREPYTCGSCAHRVTNYGYPKCIAHNGVFVKRSAAADVRAFWPACTAYRLQPAEDPENGR